MRRVWMVFVIALTLTSVAIADGEQNGTGTPTGQMAADCSSMSTDMQAFAKKLNPNNKMIFCQKMNDGQRSLSMQMSAQADSSGKPVMTPDQAVQKVAKDNNLMAPAKGPSGCPVK